MLTNIRVIEYFFSTLFIIRKIQIKNQLEKGKINLYKNNIKKPLN
jgi:hypothetical protein